MSRDTRLSAVLHLLLHIAGSKTPMTSEALAKAMQTNPVVVRRMLAGLREYGQLRSGKGHGGGWTLARPLDQITLRDVYEALGTPTLFAIGNRSDNPQCLVEQAVNAALNDTFDAAEALLLARLGDVTLAALDADFRARFAALPASHHKDHHHG